MKQGKQHAVRSHLFRKTDRQRHTKYLLLILHLLCCRNFPFKMKSQKKISYSQSKNLCTCPHLTEREQLQRIIIVVKYRGEGRARTKEKTIHQKPGQDSVLLTRRWETWWVVHHCLLCVRAMFQAVAKPQWQLAHMNLKEPSVAQA